MGWIVQNRASFGLRYQNLTLWTKAWELGNKLHAQYGANNLMLGPPGERVLDEDGASLLNAHLTNTVRETKVHKRYREGNVLLQPVRPCLLPSCILMGCYDGYAEQWPEHSKPAYFARILPQFLEHVQDKVKFERVVKQTLLTNWTAMMQATPCLYPDFQAMIRSDGQLFHIDMDRCFLPAGATAKNRWTDDCFDKTLSTIHAAINS